MSRLVSCSLACLCAVALGGGALSSQDDDAAAQVASLRSRAQEASSVDDQVALLREARDVARDADLATAHIDLDLGRALAELGYLDEALAFLYDAAKELEGDVDATLGLTGGLMKQYDDYFARGETLNAESSLQQAERALEPLVADHGDREDVQREWARILSRTRGREAESVPLYMQLLRTSPDEIALHSEFVKAVGAAGEFDQALGFYQGLEMDRALRYWYLGETYVARGHHHFNRYLDDQEAIDAYQAAERHILEAGRINPDYSASASENASYHRAWAGWVMLRAERLTDAWETFRAALGRMPTNDSAIQGLSFLGSKFNERADLLSARELYRQLCQWTPDRSDFWNNYGLMCRDTGRYEEAYLAYRKAMAITPNDPRVINDAALMLQYHLNRDLDQAERWLLDARQIARDNWINAPDQTTADDQLLVYGDSLVNLWRLYDHQGRMEEACAMIDELRDADPTREELPPRLETSDDA